MQTTRPHGQTFADWCRKWNIPAPAIEELASIPDLAVPAGETTTVQRIRLDASAAGLTLWRNNSGVMVNPTGRPVRFGLGNESAAFNRIMKSSDLIGIQPGGRFVAIEVKKPGWAWKGTEREVAQANFIHHVRKLGGFAGFATSWTDVAEALR